MLSDYLLASCYLLNTLKSDILCAFLYEAVMLIKKEQVLVNYKCSQLLLSVSNIPQQGIRVTC